MSTSGETADLMVREGIQITESAVKLAGLGAKNLAALLIALANDNQKLSGKTNLKRLIHDGEELTIFSVKREDLKGFQMEAKRYGVLFYPIVNKVEKTGTVEIMAKARDAKQINRIFERMGYPAPVREDAAVKKENARAPSESSLKERGTGARASMEATMEKPDERPSVRSRLMALQAAAEREELRQLSDDAVMRVTSEPNAYLRYLDTQAINPQYSAANVMLAMAQNPDITYINSLENWGRLGRSVNREETGLKIRVSDPYVKDGRQYHGYKIGRVFDVTQTHGKAVPAPLTLRDNTPEMEAALSRLLDSAGVPVVTDAAMYQDAFYDPKAQRITVSTRLSDSKTFAALAREIVHAGIHDRGRYPYYSREDCAMDAECVSYMLCRNFSIDVPQPNVSRVGQAFDGMEAQDRRSVVDSLQKYFRRLQKDIQREISPQERKQPEQNRTVR